MEEKVKIDGIWQKKAKRRTPSASKEPG